MPHLNVSNDQSLYYRDEGDASGAPVVFAHALGLDQTAWDRVLPLLPSGLRLVRFDLRGHGQSSVPPGPYSMGALIKDAEALCAALGLKDAVFVGNSIGGMIAQGLAAKRLDLVRGLVLSNTAAKIGTREVWNDRIALIEKMGTEAIAGATMERWFAKSFRDTPQAQACRALVSGTSDIGYAGCAAAIAGTDFYTTTAALRLPTLVVAGGHDGSTPPDLVRETADLIPGANFRLLHRAGHLPCIDQPEAFATLLGNFLSEIGHAQGK